MITVDKFHVGPWVCEKAGGVFTQEDSQAIGLIDNGDLLMGVLYNNYTQNNVFAHIRADKPLTPAFVKIMFDYPFNQLKVKRITAPIKSTNKRAIEFVQRLDFVIECKLAQAIPDGDMHIYVLWREKCRYL